MEYNNSSLSDTIHHLLTTYLDPKTPQAVRDDYMVFLTDRFSRSRIEMIIENWPSDAASFDMFYSHLIAMYRANAENAKERDKKLRSIPHFDNLAKATIERIGGLTIPVIEDTDNRVVPQTPSQKEASWAQCTRYDLVVEQLAHVKTKTNQEKVFDFLKTLLSIPQQRQLELDLNEKMKEIEVEGKDTLKIFHKGKMNIMGSNIDTIVDNKKKRK